MDFGPIGRQSEAITARLGPTLVVAGPGAGKTFCLIARIDHLIESLGIGPERICAVTFTNRAAEEISSRLRLTLGGRAETLTRGTLHSLSVKILREYAEHQGLTQGFGIADESYQLIALRRIGVRNEKAARRLLRLFGLHRLKGHPMDRDEDRLFREYLAHLRQRNMVDFDDIIVATARLFTEHPDIADRVASRWDYLLIDEFQDLNAQQYSIITRLAQPHCQIFAVGDDDQSIFSWTGADPGILRRFERDYGVDPIILNRDFRCARQISCAARHLLKSNLNLFQKDIIAERGEADFPVMVYSFANEDEEASWLIGDIEADRARSGLDWGAYAILYRVHETGRHLEGRLLLHGIRCRLARGHSIHDDNVIQYVAAALRVVMSPDDSIAIEALAERMLPPNLFQHLQALSGSGSFLGAVRAFAQSSRGEADGKLAWRFVFHAENLSAMREAHDSLDSLVEDLLSQRIERYSGALEECCDQLTDPAHDPTVARLAEDISAALANNGTIWIGPAEGLEIALRGMLDSVGYTSSYITPNHKPAPYDIVLDTRDIGSHGHPLKLFKTLQLLQSRTFRDDFRSYVIFDVETTGLEIATSEIVEIAAVRVVDGQVAGTFRSLIRCAGSISAEAQRIHGYSDDDLRDAPPFADVLPRFCDFVGDLVLVAHNGRKFDVPLLRRLTAETGCEADLRFFDTLPLARMLFPGGRVGLGHLAENFSVDPGRAHRAEDDVRTLEQVFRELKKLKVRVARKTAMANLLDYLGLGLALVPQDDWTDEHRLLFNIGRFRCLGRYSKCLEFYSDECERLPPANRPDTDEVIRRLGGQALRKALLREKTPDELYPESIARLRILIAASQVPSLDESIRRFLEIITLSASEGVTVDAHHVNLLTLHSTKGLEFSRVYIVGTEDAQIPGSVAPLQMTTFDLDEARRLLYVGMTRARDRLVLTRVRQRFGKDGGGNLFLDEVGLRTMNDE